MDLLSRATLILSLEREGFLVMDCAECRAFFYTADDPRTVFAPRHQASVRCASGKRPHCSCDSCF